MIFFGGSEADADTVNPINIDMIISSICPAFIVTFLLCWYIIDNYYFIIIYIILYLCQIKVRFSPGRLLLFYLNRVPDRGASVLAGLNKVSYYGDIGGKVEGADTALPFSA